MAFLSETLDQAARLRDLVRRTTPGVAASVADGLRPSEGPRSCRVLAIASGKGGVGKTVTCVNLAIALARGGARVLLLDGDLGTANAELMLGVRPVRRLDDVMGVEDPAAAMERVTIEIERVRSGDRRGGLSLIAGASRLTELSGEDRVHLARMLSCAESSHDFILIDTSAGVGPAVMELVGIADACLVVTTPEPTAISDAYALVKRHCASAKEAPRLGLVVNQVRGRAEGIDVHRRFDAAATRFLGTSVALLGCVPTDQAVRTSVSEQNPLVLASPNAPSAREVNAIKHEVAAWLCGQSVDKGKKSTRSWWERLGVFA